MTVINRTCQLSGYAVTQQPPRCIHVVLENNIHELIFTEVSQGAVDDLLAEFANLLRQSDPNDTVRVITQNGDQKPQPMSYALARTRILLRTVPRRPAMRVALVENSFFSKLLDGMFRALITRRDRLRVFHNADREKMLEWLRGDD